ncbi:MAG TPA: 4-(cytidine 5'-diphospho)-2-C-methyl-D-erythritol kinase [Thermomicrobiales bacterium]|nr:4-(cytidine 5'-diphospho)-2-C-methyl-D-erythritol kinase [Thermomicrobiales bacterium]
MSIAAAAKLNLGLEVLRRRSDGYHEVRTVLQTVSITDNLTISESGILQVVSPGFDLPTGENLVLSAAREITRELDTPPVRIDLQKTIPAAAGLGGASSDAASTLRAILALWRRYCSPTDLAALAARLGSDVPFFLTGGTALASGRGEEIAPLPPLPLVWFVVAVPQLNLVHKTANMYRQLTMADFTDGTEVEGIAATIASGDLPNWSGMPNPFMRPLIESHPQLHALHDAFRFAGAPFVAVTGAGPGHFTAVPERGDADAIRAVVAERYAEPLITFVCTPLPASPDPIVTTGS